MIKARLTKFRELRVHHGVNLETIAKKLNVSKAYVSMIETGKRSLDYEMAIQMAEIFNLTPDQVFYKDVCATLKPRVVRLKTKKAVK